MRERRLTFGGRLLCPFLRPFFLTDADEGRVARAAETLWTLGERVAAAALKEPAVLRELCVSGEEERLARIDPGCPIASTAARADAFLLPGSLRFAEYNAESPAGPGYAQRLAELFDGEPLMARFRERFDARFYTPIERLLDALVASYRDWGGKASPPRIAIVDWGDGRRFDLIPYLREHRDRFVLKPNDEYGGTGVTLGWETDARAWDDAIARAVKESDRGWVAQERIEIRREPFPRCEGDRIEERDMLVGFAPYLFRGKVAGFLTRLSATGLANVTSRGGRVPAVVVGELA